MGAYSQEYGLARSGGSPQAIHEPLVGEWTRQFEVSGDPYAFDYPVPASQAFWSVYREPVSHFLWYAGEIVDALAGLSSHRINGDAREGATILNQLAYPAHMRLVEDRGGELHQTWVTPSLISTLAVMAMVQATGGRYIGKCEACGRLFITTRSSKRYCCDKHRERIKKQRQRKPTEQPHSKEESHDEAT